RLEDTCALNRIENIQLGIGLFHLLMNFAWMILSTHRGAIEQAGSLAWYIGRLGLSRLGNSKPDYQTLVDLFTVVLQANVLVYWELTTGKSLDELSKEKPTAAQLLDLARQMHAKY
ncbi:hypothetical protein CONPUDRAFT_42305, partial [Coniophora puteana RWD-64-598 SS2]